MVNWFCLSENFNQTLTHKKMKLKKQLERIKESTDNELEKWVIEEIIDGRESDEEIKTFFEDLRVSGCKGGMISELIYYSDTHKFFDEFQGEIEELKEEMEDSMGEPLQIKGDVKNWLAWFGFEEMAFKIENNISTN